jgi:hypothetical protein
MLQLSTSLQNIPVMSLRTGGQIATALSPIINPNNLKIEGFWCQDDFEGKRLVLLTQDIRDTLPQGFVVNDHDVLSEAEELVRLKDILAMNFQRRPYANSRGHPEKNHHSRNTETGKSRPTRYCSDCIDGGFAL